MVKLYLLGQPRVEFDGQLVSWPSEKILALLAYLAVTGETFTRPQLEGLLWGESAEDKAKMSLRTALYNISKALGGVLITGRKTAAFDQTQPSMIDVQLFAESIEVRTMAALETAVTLVRGEFLQGVYLEDAPEFEHWLLLTRERLRYQYLDALHMLIERAMAAHETEKAADYIRRFLAVEPWQEAMHRQLMLLLARRGAMNEALRQYQHCRQMLADELGVSPAPETETVMTKIRLARTLRRTNLPVQKNRFYGRESLLAELTGRLATQRLLTILGVGGSGKTRLAIELGGRVTERFLHGVGFVSLAAVDGRTGEHLQETVARVIVTQLADAGMMAPLQGEAVAHLLSQMAGREMLLILDNFEQLLDAADLVDQLYQQAADLVLVVTSRERLALLQEQVIPLAGLAYTAEGETAVSETAGAQLFMHTAQRVKLDFAPDDMGALSEICRLVDGLPLALEMTAVWASQQSCTAIAQQLAASLDVLTSPYRNLPARQRSMRVVLSHSWERLPEREQQVLARCAVFHDPFDGEAAEMVAEGDGEILTHLVHRAVLAELVDGRYQLHPLWRQFLQEIGGWLITEAAEKHTGYFAGKLAIHTAALEGAGQQKSLAEIGRWETDLVAAWRYAIAHQLWALTDQMIYGLFLYHECLNLYDTAAQLLGRLSHALDEKQGGSDRNRLALVWAYQAWVMWDLEKATALAGRAYALCERRTRSHAQAALVLAAKQHDQLDFVAARRLGLEAIAVARPLADRRTVARALTLLALGTVPSRLNEPEKGEQWFQEALQLCQQMGDKRGEAIILHNIGWSYFYQERYAEAEPVMRQVGQLLREIDAPYQQGVAEMMLTRILAMQGELEAAEQQLLATLAEAQQLQATVLMLQLLTVLATEIYPASGRAAEAVMLIDFLNQHPELTSHLRQHLNETGEGIVSGLSEEAQATAHMRASGWRLEMVLRLVRTEFADRS